MKEINDLVLSERNSLYRKSKSIVANMDGINHIVFYLINGDDGFDEEKTDRMIDAMIDYLPDDFKKTKIQFYKDYLFIALLLAYQQGKYQNREYLEFIGLDHLGDVIADVGLGRDTTFASVINRALIEDSFLIANHGTKLVTGSVSDLDGYLEKIYRFRKKNYAFINSDIYHPMFAGVGAIVDVLNGKKHDKRLDRFSSEAYYEDLPHEWPCKERFIKSYYRYRDNYFKKGIRDDFQKNIEKVVKYYLIDTGRSVYNNEDTRKKATMIVERAERQMFDIL